MYDPHFSNFGRPPIPNDLRKDSAPMHPGFWRRRVLKVFTPYGHLGQWTVTILASFHSPAPRRLQIKFEQHRPDGFSGEVIWSFQQFSHTKKPTWPRCKKVKRQCTTLILATLVDLPSPMICAKIQPQGILGSGEDFLRFLPYMGMTAILVYGLRPFYIHAIPHTVRQNLTEFWPFWTPFPIRFSNLTEFSYHLISYFLKN